LPVGDVYRLVFGNAVSTEPTAFWKSPVNAISTFA
jgi:hypothetical protein